MVIHGRLFAQWLHHAYPRSCPLPVSHKRQELPRDFSLRTGEDYIATVEEMRRYAAKNASTSCEMAWSATEELMDTKPKARPPVAPPVALAVALAAAAAVAGTLLARLCRRRETARGPLLAAEPAV